MVDNGFVLQAERLTWSQEEIPLILSNWSDEIHKGEWKIKKGKKYYVKVSIKIESWE